MREGIVKHESEYDISDASDYSPELRGHLEAQIVNVADELAYTAHDLDDGLRSGMITPRMLEGITLWEILLESVGIRGAAIDDLARHRLIRRMIGLEVSDLVETTDQRLRESNVRSVEELQRLPYNVMTFSEDMARRNREMKDFLYAQALPPLPGGAHGGESRASDFGPVPCVQRRTGNPAQACIRAGRGIWAGAHDLRLYRRDDGSLCD